MEYMPKVKVHSSVSPILTGFDNTIWTYRGSPLVYTTPILKLAKSSRARMSLKP